MKNTASPLKKNLLCAILACNALCLSPQIHAAATLVWDPNISGAPSDGSGTWYGANAWWNGTTDMTWTNGAAVVIGTNTPGNYSIVLDSAVTAASVTFKTNNYTLSGSTLTTGGITLSAGVSAAINCPISTPGNGISVGAGGSTLTLGSNYTCTTGNPTWAGSSQAVSTLNITNGTYSDGAGTFTANGLTVNQTGGILNMNSFTTGRTASDTWNLSGGQINGISATSPGNSILIARDGAASVAGVLNVSGTGLVSTKAGVGITIAGSAVTANGVLTVSGGTIQTGLGPSGTPGTFNAGLGNIVFFATAGTYAAGAKAILNISGGTVAAKGLVFGSAGVSSYVNNPACQVNVSGGLTYLDSGGMALNTGATGLNSLVLNLSGGTIAATSPWTASVPMMLNTTNGNLTLQAADVNGSPFDITLAGAVSGTGGLNKTGGGNLILTGTNTYSGPTVVSAGQLTVYANGATSIGSVSLTNSGTILSSVLTATSKTWTTSGLALTNGTTADFSFGAFQASPTVPLIRVNGDLTLDSSDSFTLEGTALIVGTFPLMTCTGTLTLNNGPSLPAVTSVPGGVTANLSQSGNTINLVITASPNSPLNWGASASGPWDFSTFDWVNAGTGSPTNYSDGLAVNFNDNGQGAVTINLAGNVQPVSITANNNSAGTATYAITGNGSISGNTGVLLQGTGTLALGTTNTYSGGTIVNSGALAINYGGDGTGPTGIGEGPLTLNPGAVIDNTSGTDVTLNSPFVPQTWNGNFSFAGTTNLNLGGGTVTLGTSPVQVTVLSNTLRFDGTISDSSGLHNQLVVQGPGALTLAGPSTYSGGTVLNSGKLNINGIGDGGADTAIGTGTFTINGGTIDNTSGSDLTFLVSIPKVWTASFTFAGSGNLDFGPGTINVSGLTLTLQNGATLATEGGMAPVGTGNLTLSGNGTFRTSGSNPNTFPTGPSLTTIVGNGALFQMDKASSSSIHSTANLTVNTGGTARVTGTGGLQIGTPAAGTLTLGGGLLDLNGSSETIFAMTFNSGTLQNNSATPATLTIGSHINLAGAACKFDVTNTSGALTIPSLVSGTGSLIKTGDGALNLGGTNTYTGSTTVSNGLLTFTTATLANRNYTVAGGALQVLLDPAGTKLQMAMSNLTFGVGVRLGFDLAAGAFGDATAPVISAGALSMNGNVAVDVSNAPGDTADEVLLTYTSRQGPGLFVAGNIPAGAYIYDNPAGRTVSLTYTQPPPPAPAISGVGTVHTGSAVTGIIVSGVHGPAGGSYTVMSSTNVALSPLSAWTPGQSGSFDASGNFNITNAVNPAVPQMFYLLRVP